MRKLSVQIQKWTEAAVGTVERTAPESIKLILPGAWAPDRILAWARAGGKRLYLRLHVDGDGQDLGQMPRNTANLIDLARELRSLFTANGLTVEIICLTVINERLQTLADLDRRVGPEIAAINQISDAGFTAGFLNASVGNPPRLRGAIVDGQLVGEDDDWRRLFPLLKVARARNAIAILHQYWRDNPREPWTALRHRLVWERLPAEYRVRMAFGECGIDNGVGTNILGGYRFLGVEPSIYARDHLAPFAEEITKDPYVVDAHLFLCGSGHDSWHKDGKGGWVDFDVAGEGDVEALLRRDFTGPALWSPTADIAPQPAPIRPPAETGRPAPAPPPIKPSPVKEPTMPGLRDARGTLPTLTGTWPQLTYHSRPVSEIVGGTVHYTGGPANQTPEAIARYQISEQAIPQTGADQPFPGLAYTIVVVEDGTAVIGHDLAARVWHSSAVVDGVAWNAVRMGIVYTGKGRPNPAQIKGIAAAIRWGELQQGLGRLWSIDGHRDHVATPCPPEWPTWRGEVVAELVRLRGGTVPDRVIPTDAKLEANVLAPIFKAQEWLRVNAKTDRQRRWQAVLDFAFRDLKGEVA